MNILIGIDWSTAKHDIAFMNEQGAIIQQLIIEHSAAGFNELDQSRAKLGVAAADCLVGIETAHNLFVDFLWSRDYSQIYIVPPHVTSSCRPRYSASRAHTDQTDASLIADILRTDRHRLHPWYPDTQLTRRMRHLAHWLQTQTQDIIRESNRLRAELLRYYPAALELFGGLTVQITLAFIIQYPTPTAAASLSYEEFVAFAHQQAYSNRQCLPQQYARFQQSQPQASDETVQVHQEHGRILAQHLLTLVKTKAANQRQLTRLFEQHPDHAIFASLPGAGKWLAPALLTKFGADRRRFPTATSLQAIAGTCPVTDQSGKRRRVRFRHACDKSFRQITQQWARTSLKESVWANTYWQQARARGHGKNDAYRRLGNRWLAIAWKLWQTKQPYDETYHLKQCALRRKPRR